MAIDTPVVALTLTGSLLSVLGTLFILICYAILPQKRHVRHALIINLTIADFINAANNSTSGLWVVIENEELHAGTGCTINGFLGQLSIQAVDFTILIITIVTMWIVTSSHSTRELSVGHILVCCFVPWAIPCITSGIGLFLGKYGPASSNWCWIQPKPVHLRYVLTHGWRFAIIVAVLTMCVYIQIYIRRHTRMMDHAVKSEEVQGWKEATRANLKEKFENSDIEMQNNASHVTSPAPSGPSKLTYETGAPVSTNPKAQTRRLERIRSTLYKSDIDPQEEAMVRTQAKNQQLTIQRAMLLHAYPIFYIILWIPGLAMRVTQATGGTSRVLEYMQSSTQFIGFANALTFGWNEKIGTQMKAKFRAKLGDPEHGTKLKDKFRGWFGDSNHGIQLKESIQRKFANSNPNQRT